MKIFRFNRFQITTLLIILTFLLVITPALATESIFKKASDGAKQAINQAYGGGAEVDLSGKPLIRILISVINSLLVFVGVLFFLLIIYAGWTWFFARGREEEIEKAKKMIRGAIVGIIIIISARILTEFILTQVGGIIDTVAPPSTD